MMKKRKKKMAGKKTDSDDNTTNIIINENLEPECIAVFIDKNDGHHVVEFNPYHNKNLGYETIDVVNVLHGRD